MGPVVVDAAERALLRRRLLRWGRANFKNYPWRFEQNAWLTLVSEVLLQRTQARQVVETFDRFRTLFPTPLHLARAPREFVDEVLFPLGLHSRADVLRGLAELSTVTGGTPPEDPEMLRAVRGVGGYTVAAWLSLHRNRRAAIIDANVYRWLGRMFARPFGRDPRRVRWVRDLANDLTPRRSFRAFNYAVLDFTMNVCVPRAPHCPDCPLADRCASHSAPRSKRLAPAKHQSATRPRRKSLRLAVT
jgi:A/G-specific adenine glycosylase